MSNLSLDAAPNDAAYALAHGLSPEAFHAAWADRIAAPMTGLDRHARLYVGYARVNVQRSRLVTDAYVPSDRLAAALRRLPEGQTWMVLTEDWCIDSAFGLPVVEAAAARAPGVTLRIVPRDAHLDVMDRYLTNGARAIPVLVAFDHDGREAWRWGPRTEAGAAQRSALKDSGLDGNALSAAMNAWFESGGWSHLDAELAERIERQLGHPA